jgi:hypothetical protein
MSLCSLTWNLKSQNDRFDITLVDGEGEGLEVNTFEAQDGGDDEDDDMLLSRRGDYGEDESGDEFETIDSEPVLISHTGQEGASVVINGEVVSLLRRDDHEEQQEGGYGEGDRRC